MRGEKSVTPILSPSILGSPPHARGKANCQDFFKSNLGITPACAGKSGRMAKDRKRDGDHPRMRGEKPPDGLSFPQTAGSPPHARGKGLNTSIICCILAQNTYLHRNFV